MKFSVIVSEPAEIDLEEIHAYIEMHDSRERADNLFDAIGQRLVALADMPQRGHFPPEFVRLGVHDFREVHHKPYRIIYAIAAKTVTVYAVLDGRRDMQTLLMKRLLR